jgi:hypothetical protein
MIRIDTTWYIDTPRRGIDPVLELSERAAQGLVLCRGIILVEGTAIRLTGQSYYSTILGLEAA